MPTPRSIVRSSGLTAQPQLSGNRSIFLGDMLFRSIVEPEPLEREMDIIRREFDMGLDDPDRVLSYLIFGTSFPGASLPLPGDRDSGRV